MTYIVSGGALNSTHSLCDDSVLEDAYFITIRYTKIHFHFNYYTVNA